MTEDTNISPLFPLNVVLFPGSILQLQIFEQRYLNLVRSCMKGNHGFTVALIHEGKEVDDTPTIYSVGTYVEITDFETLENGLLGITVKAKQKVLIGPPNAQHDGLLKAEISILDDDIADDRQLDDRYFHLKDVLESLVKHPLLRSQYPDINYRSALEISYRLSEFLPISNSDKQALLELNSAELRLQKLDDIVRQMQESG